MPCIIITFKEKRTGKLKTREINTLSGFNQLREVHNWLATRGRAQHESELEFVEYTVLHNRNREVGL